MSRITDQWTDTLIEAFGWTEAVIRGAKAEQLFLQYAKKAYDEVEFFENDREKQVAGIDFTFRKKTWSRAYSADVKGNLHVDGRFIIDNKQDGWLRDRGKRSDRIVHICVDDGSGVQYDRREMIQLLDRYTLPNNLLFVASTDLLLNKVLKRFKCQKSQ